MSRELNFDFRDLKRFQKTLERMERLPQKVVNAAAGKGATVVGRAIRAAAPRGKTRQLSKGFKRIAEKSRVKGKKVYQYAMDPAKNAIFQKPIPMPGAKHPGDRRSKWKHAYYPASVEYGFLTRSKGGGLEYVPGTHFARNATETARPEAEHMIVKALADGLEAEWKKKHDR